MTFGAPSFDLRQLRYFVAIVEAGSLSRAAERVHVAQSALSSHVRRMEESLGVTLLVRGPKGIQPTPAGAKLLNHARTVLDQLNAAERELRSEREEPCGAVTIGIPSGVGRVLNSPLFDACQRGLPRVSLRIAEVLPGHVLEWLAAGEIKLGIHYELGPAADDARPLAEEHFYLVCGAPEPSLGETIELRELTRFPLTLPTCNHNPQQCVATRAESVGVHLEIDTRVDSLATILDRVCSKPAHTVLTPAAFLPEWRAGKVWAYRICGLSPRRVMLSVGASSKGDAAVTAVERTVRSVAASLTAAGDWPQQLRAER